MTDHAFCEQCGATIAAHAKHCRSCGSAQSLWTPPLEAPPPRHPSGRAADLRATADDLRQAAGVRLSATVVPGFPGRSLGEILGYTLIGGLIACVCSWLVTWLLLELGIGLSDVDTSAVSLSSAAGLLVPLVLGAPLVLDVAADGEVAAATFSFPLTSLVIVPSGIVMVVAFVVGRASRPAAADQAWKLGAAIGIPFALGVSLLAASFGGPVGTELLEDLGTDDSGRIDIGPAGGWTILYSLLWGALGGALGGRLSVLGMAQPATPRASRTPGAVLSGSARGLRFALLATVVLLLIGLAVTLFVQVLRGDFEADLPEVASVLLTVPVLVIGLLLGSQGAGYELDGFASLDRGDVFPELAGQTTFHFWDAGPAGLLILLVTATTVLALIRAGRAAARAALPTRLSASVWTGTAIALPWVAALLMLSSLASLTVGGTTGELVEIEGRVGPILAEIVLLGGLIAALGGALGGRIAWQEMHVPGVASAWRRFLMGPPHASWVPPAGAAGPTPAPFADAGFAAPMLRQSTPAFPAGPPAAAFCWRCGHRMTLDDRFCDACGHQQPVATATGRP